MPKLTIKPEDLKRSVVLDQGWYGVEVTSIGEEPNKAGDALNIIVDMVGLQSSDPDRNKASGVPLRRYFTEKAPGFAVNFLKACGATVGEAGGTFEFSGAVGKKLDAFIKPRPYEGRMTNDVADFRALEG